MPANYVVSCMRAPVKITSGKAPVIVSALAVPAFKYNNISVGQLTKSNNLLLTQKGVYLRPKEEQRSAKAK